MSGRDCEVSRCIRVVPGADELPGAPTLYALQLGLENFCFCRSSHHV